MRPAVALLALLAACSKDAPQPPPASPEVRWVRVEIARVPFSLFLPEPWTKEIRPQAHTLGILCLGPEEDGFKPTVQLFWWEKPRPLDEFFRAEKERRRASIHPVELVGEAPARVAGMAARRLVYDEAHPAGRFRTVDWYLSGAKGHGILRMTARREGFIRYGPLFDEFARRAR